MVEIQLRDWAAGRDCLMHRKLYVGGWLLSNHYTGVKLFFGNVLLDYVDKQVSAEFVQFELFLWQQEMLALGGIIDDHCLGHPLRHIVLVFTVWLVGHQSL